MSISGPISRRTHSRREIVLPEVDAVGSGGDGDVGPVVHHKERAEPVRGRAEILAPPEQVPRFSILGA